MLATQFANITETKHPEVIKMLFLKHKNLQDLGKKLSETVCWGVVNGTNIFSENIQTPRIIRFYEPFKPESKKYR